MENELDFKGLDFKGLEVKGRGRLELDSTRGFDFAEEELDSTIELEVEFTEEGLDMIQSWQEDWWMQVYRYHTRSSCCQGWMLLNP